MNANIAPERSTMTIMKEVIFAARNAWSLRAVECVMEERGNEEAVEVAVEEESKVRDAAERGMTGSVLGT